jgi:2-dehydro-3-deoxygluconokinase
MVKIIAFGELMLRLTPNVPAEKIYSATSLNVNYAGAESNVATALSRLGNASGFVTKLPSNALGDAAVSSLAKFGIDAQEIIRGGQRIGSYFIELGASIRPSSVIYDRANSAIAAITENEFDWHNILKDKQWLHVSGITPALSKQCADETLKSVKIAKSMGLKVSFDLNFRRTLWADVAAARRIFSEILTYTDLVHGNCGVLQDVFALDYAADNALQRTMDAAKEVQQKFNVKSVALTMRDHHSASNNSLGGVFLDQSECAVSRSYKVDILDRFGTGDAFAAGILHGILNDYSPQQSVDFATALFALKHTIHGDQFTGNQAEVESIMAGNISGHVLR